METGITTSLPFPWAQLIFSDGSKSYPIYADFHLCEEGAKNGKELVWNIKEEKLITGLYIQLTGSHFASGENIFHHNTSLGHGLVKLDPYWFLIKWEHLDVYRTKDLRTQRENQIFLLETPTRYLDL